VPLGGARGLGNRNVDFLPGHGEPRGCHPVSQSDLHAGGNQRPRVHRDWEVQHTFHLDGGCGPKLLEIIRLKLNNVLHVSNPTDVGCEVQPDVGLWGGLQNPYPSVAQTANQIASEVPEIFASGALSLHNLAGSPPHRSSGHAIGDDHLLPT